MSHEYLLEVMDVTTPIQDSLNNSTPFEFVNGHEVCGLLKMVKEQLLNG